MTFFEYVKLGFVLLYIGFADWLHIPKVVSVALTVFFSPLALLLSLGWYLFVKIFSGFKH